MPIELEGEEKEKDEEQQPPPETILEKKEERDPDEAVLAEQAIIEYAHQILEMFREQAENAMASVNAFLSAEADKATFDDRAFLDTLGKSYLDQVMGVFGGKDTPMGAYVFSQLDGRIDWAVAEEVQSYFFVDELQRAVRDVAWDLRDNLQSVLSNEWDGLRDLAYEGSTDFIAAIHAFGLPQASFNASQLSQPMISTAQAFRESKPREQEQKIDQDQQQVVEEEKKDMEQEETQQLAMEEEEKKEIAL
jgi:hypothetical protein